jgi:hypothetical protein
LERLIYGDSAQKRGPLTGSGAIRPLQLNKTADYAVANPPHRSGIL